MDLWGGDEPPLSLAEERDISRRGKAGRGTRRKRGGAGAGGPASTPPLSNEEYIRIVSQPSTLLRNSANILRGFLAPVTKSVLCVNGVILGHRAAKTIQRHYRRCLARKRGFKRAMLELWRKQERDTARVAALIAQKGRGLHAHTTPSKQRPAAHGQAHGGGRTRGHGDKHRGGGWKDEVAPEVKDQVLAEYTLMMTRAYCRAVDAWAAKHGVECRRLTLAAHSLRRQTAEQRAELDRLLRKRSRIRVNPTLEAEIPALNQFLANIMQQRLETMAQLCLLPTRPAMDWAPTKQHLQTLVARAKKSTRGKALVRVREPAGTAHAHAHAHQPSQPASPLISHATPRTRAFVPLTENEVTELRLMASEYELPPLVDAFPLSRPPTSDADAMNGMRPARYVMPKDHGPKLPKRKRGVRLPKIVCDHPCEVHKRPGGWLVVPVQSTKADLRSPDVGGAGPGGEGVESPTTPPPCHYPPAANHTAFARVPRPPPLAQKANPWGAADDVPPELVQGPKPPLRRAFLAEQPFPAMKFK